MLKIFFGKSLIVWIFFLVKLIVCKIVVFELKVGSFNLISLLFGFGKISILLFEVFFIFGKFIFVGN